MKTTFDLPDALLHRAKAVAARQGRPLREFIAEVLVRAVAVEERSARIAPNAEARWEAFVSKLERLPDGTYFNPDGIQDERFFEILETLRSERLSQQMRNPFEGFGFDDGVPPSLSSPAADSPEAPG